MEENERKLEETKKTPVHTANSSGDNSTEFDYSFVSSTARVAAYDDLRSAPRVTTINPANTNEFIENLTTTIYSQAQGMGGDIPYTVVREVTENFIHAQFKEIVVSILDSGNTIRFADQGPGIVSKEQAQRPGFSSATESMKAYIRGVGSGLPIVKEYLSVSKGSITIEDNLTAGSVITVSTKAQIEKPSSQTHVPAGFSSYSKQANTISLSSKEKAFLWALLQEGELGITNIANITGTAASSTHSIFSRLEKKGLVKKVERSKRVLTDKGYEVAEQLA